MYILIKQGFDKKNIVTPFIKEFDKKQINGKLLIEYSKNPSMINQLKDKFSKRNQLSGIWLVLTNEISNIDLVDKVNADNNAMANDKAVGNVSVSNKNAHINVVYSDTGSPIARNGEKDPDQLEIDMNQSPSVELEMEQEEGHTFQ